MDFKFEKRFEELRDENTVPLHTRLLSLSKFDLSITPSEKPEEKFISYARHKQELSKNNDGFVIVENVSELGSKEKKYIGMMVHEIFTKRDSPRSEKKGKAEIDIENLFSNENAITKFLLDAQSSLLNTSFVVLLHQTKFDYLSKILKLIVASKLNRLAFRGFPESRKDREGAGTDKQNTDKKG